MRQNRPWATLAFTAPNVCWACALASPVTFLTGDHVMQIGFDQISPSASSTRDLGTRLPKQPILSVLNTQPLSFCFNAQKNSISIIHHRNFQFLELFTLFYANIPREKNVYPGRHFESCSAGSWYQSRS